MSVAGDGRPRSLLVRPAELTDSEAMAALSLAALGSARSEPRDAISDSNRRAIVAEVDGALVGWAKTHYYDEASGAAPAGHYLGGVTVHPDFRRRGIGSALTLARLDWIWIRETDAWFVTNARNTASIALHAKFGFAEVARAGEFHGTTFDGGVGILFRATHARSEPISRR